MPISIASQVLGTLSVTVAETTGTLEVAVLSTAPAVLSIELGTPGPAATVTVGETTTLASGSPATVNNVGTSLNAILDFGIPQGIPGVVAATAPIIYDSGTQTVGVDTSYWIRSPLVSATDGQIPAWDAATSRSVWIDNSARSLFLVGTNKSGATIPKGAAVYVSGGQGSRPVISLAKADAEAASSQTIGITTEAIANNGNGNVVVRGLADRLNTSAYTEGQILYLSPTVAGGFTTTLPTQPLHGVVIGYVTRSSATVGAIEVAIQNYQELEELSDVLVSGRTNNDLLTWDSSAGVWKNKSFSTLGLATQAWVDAQGYLQAGALSPYLLSSTAAATYYPLTNPSGYITSSALSGYALINGSSTITVSDGYYTTQVKPEEVVVSDAYNSTHVGRSYVTVNTDTYGPVTITAGGITFGDGTTQTTAAAGAAVWGSITGTLSSQTDLASALSAKYDASNPAGYITSSALTGYATESWVSSQGYLTSSSLTGYATQSWVTSQGYITSSALSPYLLSSTAASTYYPLTNPSGYIDSSALSGYLLSSTAASTYYPLTNPSGYITSSALYPYLTSATAASTYAPLASPTFTGTVTIPAGASISGYLTTSTAASTYLTITDAGTTYQTLAGMSSYLTTATAASTYQTISGMSSYLTTASAASTYAPIASPTFTGMVTIPSGASISGYLTTSSASSTYAPLASPALTGTPTAPTPTVDDNDTSIATTAFVIGQASSTTPAATGTAAVGTSLRYARADHVHANPLPTGGTTGQVLAKVDGTNYNVQWTTAGGGSGGVDVQTFGSSTTSGTFSGASGWQKPAGAKIVEVLLIGGGGGGASGGRYATTSGRSGGAGGHGGNVYWGRFNANDLNSTETVVVGAGGTGASSVTTDNTAGSAAVVTGTNTTFKSIYVALGGNVGSGGGTTAAGAGSAFNSMIFEIAKTNVASGGGTLTNGTSATNVNTGPTVAGTSGGGGAGAAASSTTAANGGNGSSYSLLAGYSGRNSSVAGGTGGVGTSTTAATSGTTSTTWYLGGTGGGGGYYKTGNAGGAGGNGGWPGGGGGGGGASDNGNASGKGGDGANGFAIIITYF